MQVGIKINLFLLLFISYGSSKEQKMKVGKK